MRVVGPWCERQGDAEDLAQEALCRAVVAFDRTGEVPSVVWVTTVVMNLARSRLRRLRVERRHAAREPGAAPTIDPTSADHDELVAALAGLPDRQRRAVALRYLADLSVDQTAEVMGCSPATVKTHVRDAFATLRSHPGLRPTNEEERV